MTDYLKSCLQAIRRRIKPGLLLLLTAAFVLGSAAGKLSSHFTGHHLNSSAEKTISKTAVTAASDSWGLSFQKDGERPVGNATIEELKKYQAYFAADTSEKILYLTFDCGYENGNTPAILDALKKHNAPAAFFVVGTFISSNPELVREMVSAGHIVGNHTMTHPDMSGISSEDAFKKELEDVEKLYKKAVGKSMTRFYRPPRGVYSTENLAMAQKLGYSTFFWSLAYVDWIQEDQPSREEAFEKLLNRIHPGAIVLLHNTSSTNAQILDELLTRWEEMGYQFRPLTEIAGA